MININAIIVVEGNQDKAFLSSFINSEILVTNGYDLTPEKINLLKKLSDIYTLILLLDPDEAGRNIAENILKFIPNAIDLKITFKNRNNYRKQGVAECDKEAIISLLKPYVTSSLYFEEKIDLKTAYSVGLNHKSARKKLADLLKIPTGNLKTFIHYLNLLKIDIEDIREELN